MRPATFRSTADEPDPPPPLLARASRDQPRAHGTSGFQGTRVPGRALRGRAGHVQGLGHRPPRTAVCPRRVVARLVQPAAVAVFLFVVATPPWLPHIGHPWTSREDFSERSGRAPRDSAGSFATSKTAATTRI